MRILIISLFVSAVCFGQGQTVLVKDGKKIEYKALKDTTVFQDIKNADMQFVPKVNSTSGKLSSADSLLIPVFSTKDVMDYLYRIEKVAASIKNLRLPNDQEYAQLTAELNAIIKEMDKKRKGIK